MNLSHKTYGNPAVGRLWSWKLLLLLNKLVELCKIVLCFAAHSCAHDQLYSYTQTLLLCTTCTIVWSHKFVFMLQKCATYLVKAVLAVQMWTNMNSTNSIDRGENDIVWPWVTGEWRFGNAKLSHSMTLCTLMDQFIQYSLPVSGVATVGTPRLVYSLLVVAQGPVLGVQAMILELCKLEHLWLVMQSTI